MKKLFWKLTRIVLLALPLISGGCGAPNETGKSTEDVRVQIPVYTKKGPRLEVVTLSGIGDLRSVSGRYAIFYYSPKIIGTHVFGEKPRARFTKTALGVFIPQDRTSAEMATIYYHHQKLAEFDRSVGLGNLNKGPRKIAISTRINHEGKWVHNRAYYDLNADAMLFVDFTLQDLPLTLNAGVIGHEHFHSLFGKLFLKPLIALGKYKNDFDRPAASTSGKEEAQDSGASKVFQKTLYRHLLLRALNEGLADFWGWAYADDEEFVPRSLPELPERSLKPSVVNGFASAPALQSYIELLSSSDNSPEVMYEGVNHMAYILGSQYARFFRKLMTDKEGKDLSAGQKTEFLKSIIALLNSLSEQTRNLEDYNSVVEPMAVIKKFKDLNPEAARIHCKEFRHFFGGECPP